ncbi:MAG TPA: ABC transporter substrate-binding protein [Candidatus Dormibacteraeota bacterium]|nr:ABC transporter substrate-binding protein [Candidatus Dormibacteraeota bacterium]
MRSSSVRRALVVSIASVLTLVACGTSSSTNAGTIHFLGVWSGAEQASWFAVLKPFEDSTGIKVSYEASRDQDAILTSTVAAGNPPDVAGAPSPQLLSQFAKQGKLIPLNNAVDMTALQANTAPSWIKLGEPLNDGKLYQIFAWGAVKGLIWYDPKNFQAKGYNVPKSYDDLTALQSQIKGSGTTPWCVTVESGSATGWPASDWLKEIVLSQSGPDVYDKWVAGTQKWSSPEIKQAFTTFGSILGPSGGNVYGGPQYAVATNFGDVGTPMFTNPPKCYMLNQASFITSFFTSANPALTPGTDFNFFPLPDINPQFAGAHVVAGDSFAMFKDTPQARKLMQYLTTADAQTIWVKRGGKLAVNKQVSLDSYPDALSKESAQIIVTTTIGKYDATDQMPADMKAAAWADLVKFIQNQGQLNSLLAHLDSVQATAYHS